MKNWLAGLGAMFAVFSNAAADPADFERWVEGFRAEAAAAGISDAVLDEALVGLSINPRVYALNDNQPEFSRGIWDYLDSAVSTTRIENGRTKYLENQSLLTLIENAY
ncbi:MAG: lytic murein transglycosylase, partial [Pseudomonadota bacterium]